MVQFECPRVIHPLVSFTFGVHCGVPFSPDAGKGKCCIWLLNKVEIHFAKIGFVDCKWSNLNAPGSYTPCSNLLCKIRFRWLLMVQFECPRVIHPLLSSTIGVCCTVPLSLHAGKGKCCMWPIKKVEIYFSKIGFVDSKWSNLNAPGSLTPWFHSLLGCIVGCPFPLHAGKGKCCMWPIKKVEIYF